MRRRNLAGYFAKLLLVFCLACCLPRCGGQSNRNSETGRSELSPVESTGSRDSFNTAEAQYGKAIQELELAISSHGSMIHPDLAREFQHNLDIINASIRDLKSAVSQDPTNEQTKESILSLYQKKVNLMQNKLQLLSNYKDWGGFLYQLWKM